MFLLRGGCLFEEKALYAQKAGAIGVVIGLINKNDKLFVMAGIQDSTGISSSESLAAEGRDLNAPEHTLSEEEVKDYNRDLAKVKSLISFGTDSSENGNKKISEGLKIMISNLVDNLKSDKLPMKAKKNVVDLALQILSLDPDKPLTPKIYADIMAGIKANQVYAGWGIPKGEKGNDDPDVAGQATKIPVVQVTFQMLASYVPYLLHTLTLTTAQQLLWRMCYRLKYQKKLDIRIWQFLKVMQLI